MSDDLDNIEIDHFLKNIKKYRGCYASNSLPTKYSSGYYVVNLEEMGEPGTHWSCIIEEKDKIYYIDSFGFPPNKDVLNWIRKKGKEACYNTKDFQALSSSKCGYYCIYIIKKRAEGESVTSILEKFSTIRKSEKIIKNYFSL